MKPFSKTPLTNNPTLAAVLFFVTLLLFSSAIGLWIYFSPGRQVVNPYPDMEATRLIYEDKNYGTDEIYCENGQIYLSKSFIKNHIDQYIHFDGNGNYITITTRDKFFQMQTNELSAKINDKATELLFPPKLINDEPFLPADIINEIYPVSLEHIKDYNLVILEDLNRNVLQGYSKFEGAIIRKSPDLRSGIINRLKEEELVTIYQEQDDWYHIRTKEGFLGYIRTQDITLKEVKLRGKKEKDKKPLIPPHRPLGEPINLTWEHVIRETPSPDNMPSLPGVNVISPTWFHLRNSSGELINLAEKSYVEWAHDNNIKVWALFSNNFDPNLTSDFLRDPAARKNAIYQIVLYSEIYNLDGINLDFENMYLKDRDYYTQFVRELTPFLREQGLSVSVDVTFISLSENWSMSYDRAALAETVDYVMVMAYDEHWGSSPAAGSVASLPWVENNLQKILEKVPNHKLVLGIPFYTRLWEEKKQEDGSLTVSSSAHGMKGISNILNKHDAEITFDEKTQQYYAEYIENGKKYRTWLETKESIKKRLELVHKYDLAGIASWRRGFETEDIWEIIKDELSIQR